MNARKTALDVLITCRKQGAWVNAALKEHLRRDGLDGRDAALAARLCYGVTQNRMKLDFYLAQLLTGKVQSLHPVVRDILHLGLYQLYEMDKIPPSAAVNECVNLAKKLQKPAAGLVNAVLRNAIRRQGSLAEPTALADRYSHPQALVDLLASYVGPERLEPMLAANNSAPPTCVQVNTCKCTREELARRLEAEGVMATAHSWMPDCLILEGSGDLEKLAAFRGGLFYVQDPAAKLSVLCAGLAPGMQVLDCCAAPGGKSFAAAMVMGGEGQIFSADIHPHKLKLMENGASRLGLDCMTVFQQDAAADRPEWHGQMDAVLADLPCSGLGIIRKKPDIRYKALENIEQLPALQLEILLRQADYVKPGGVLMYSTCTLVRGENEGVVEKFLQLRPDFAPEPLPLPDIFPENTGGMLALVPGQYDTDGFFICRLRRQL